MSRTNIQPVDFIKIDVHGYDHRVVKGAAETFRFHQPQIARDRKRDDNRPWGPTGGSG
jgi:FkbM family methyltransferase